MSGESAPPYAALEERGRLAFQTGAGVEELINEFRQLNNEQRIAAWAWLTRNGVQDMEFARFVHSNLSRLVLEVFGTPVSEKVT